MDNYNKANFLLVEEDGSIINEYCFELVDKRVDMNSLREAFGSQHFDMWYNGQWIKFMEREDSLSHIWLTMSPSRCAMLRVRPVKFTWRDTTLYHGISGFAKEFVSLNEITKASTMTEKEQATKRTDDILEEVIHAKSPTNGYQTLRKRSVS